MPRRRGLGSILGLKLVAVTTSGMGLLIQLSLRVM